MGAIDRIEEFNKFGSILGLERMSVLMELLGNPQEALKCIHVAGTNGKGSCCRYIYEALLANGYRAGLYTSPFIEVFNERIQLDGSYISDAELEKYTAIVLETVEKMIKMGYDSPTEFEVITAVAFVYFKEAGADFAVLEVGLGGRGDSTNIIKRPLVSIITSISLDHTDRLGDTIEQIAAEKAGIIKPEVPVISNVSDPAAAKVIAGEAYRQGCLFTDASKIKPKYMSEHLGGSAVDLEIMGTDYSGVEISMTGEHQISNLTAALAAIELLRKQRIIKINRSDLYRGLKKAVQTGRFEIISEKPYIILDGAHNEAGAKALADTMAKYFGRSRVLMVCGILADKDVDGILDNFTRIASHFIACEPVSDRKLDAGSLQAKIQERFCDCEVAVSPEEAVAAAESIKGDYDAVLYAGSLYLIGEIRRILGDECNETKKVLLFYNPFSGNGMFKNNLDHIIERYQREGYLVIPVRAEKGKTLNRLLPEIDQEEFRQVIVAGGDGTINICVNALLKNNIDLPIAIFPSGTANDFASYFEMPDTIDAMIDVALGDYQVPVDVGMVNGKYFINVAAMGNMVDVSQKTDPVLKNTLGRFAYYLKGASEVTELKPIEVKLTTPENIYEEEMFFMIVMNGTSAGGFKNVSPDSEINDGLLNVILFRKMPILEMVPLGIKVLQGVHLNDHRVLTFKTDRLLIESDVDIPTDVDGEHGEKLPLDFSVLHDKIRVFVTKAERDYYERFKNSGD